MKNIEFMAWVPGRIKEKRELMGVSMKRCADLMGCTYQQWQKWENGVNMPTAENIVKICMLAQIEPNELFCVQFHEND